MTSKKSRNDTHGGQTSAAAARAMEVVVVPFPFSNQPGTKRRPALVLSVNSFNRRGHAVLAMITSAHTIPGRAM